MGQLATTFLEILVGRYRLALRADCVLGVLTDVRVADRVEVRGAPLPFTDLRALFGGEPRAVAPYGIAFEHGGGGAVVGADGVDHVRPGAAPRLASMPPFGLVQPDLFEAVLRDGGRCALVLAPTVLGGLTASQINVI